MKRNILTYLGIALVCAACTDDKLLPDMTEQEVDYVTAQLVIRVEEEVPGTDEAKTRAVDDPGTVTQTEITDLLVVQYNGTSDGDVVLGQPQFFNRGVDFQDNMELANLTVKLAAADKPTALVIIANVGDKLLVTNNTTLGDLKARYRISENKQGLFTQTSDGIDHIMLNCLKELPSIGTGSNIECKLKHNLARVNLTLKVKNSLNMSINDAIVGNVPKITHYLNSYDGFSIVTPSNQLFDFYLENPIPSQESDYTKYTYTFYVSPNLRGSTGSASEQGKNLTAPGGATYVTLNTKFAGTGDSGDDIYEYTFYMGENLIDDFNIKPNHSYDYTITFDAKGDPDIDSRVEDMSLVNFSSWERANCYILNPARLINRKFRIPVDRVDEFWGNNGYEYADNYCLNTDGLWKVEILWTDFENPIDDRKLNISKSTGIGKNDAFEVEIKPGVCGNALVALKRTDIDDPSILWSWHLWITDYNPYNAKNQDVIDGVFEYDVQGGFVHRYYSEEWKTGIYSNSFIMDRDLGATPNPEFPQFNTSKLGYQFGRKDPFPHADFLFYDANNNPINGRNFGKKVKEAPTVSDAVHNPTFFYTLNSNAYYWTEDDNYKNKEYVWFDPSVKSSSITLGEKSIFDPCPPGWCIPPTQGVFDLQSDNNNIKSTAFGFKDPYLGSEYTIYSYWPSGHTPLSGHIIFYTYSAWAYTSGFIDKYSYWICGYQDSSNYTRGIMIYRVGKNSLFNTNPAQASTSYVRPVMMRAPKTN